MNYRWGKNKWLNVKILAKIITVELNDGKVYEYCYFALDEDKFFQETKINLAPADIRSAKIVGASTNTVEFDGKSRYSAQFRDENETKYETWVYNRTFVFTDKQYAELVHTGELMIFKRLPDSDEKSELGVFKCDFCDADTGKCADVVVRFFED